MNSIKLDIKSNFQLPVNICENDLLLPQLEFWGVRGGGRLGVISGLYISDYKLPLP